MVKVNRVLVRIINAHLVSGVLMTAVLLLAVSAVLTARIEKNTGQDAYNMLRQTYQTTYTALNDVYGDFYALWRRNGLIQQALSPAGVPSGADGDVGSLLAETALNDEIVHSAQIINRDTGLVYSSRAAPAPLADADDPGSIELLREFALHFEEYRDEVFFPRTALNPAIEGALPVDLLSVIFAARADDGTIHSGMVVNIDRGRLARLANPAELPGHLLMISPDGQLIADLTGTMRTRDFSGESAMQTILSGPAEEGRLTADFLGEKMLISYRKASQLGFVFVRAVPDHLLQAETMATIRVVAVLFIVAMLFSLLISIVSIWMYYNPLNRMVKRVQEFTHPMHPAMDDEYAYLQAAYQTLHEQSRNSGLIRLIYGQFDPALLKTLRMEAPAFLTLAIMPDDSEAIDETGIDRLQQMAAGMSGWHATVTAPDCVSVVLNAAAFDDEMMDRVASQAAEMQASALDQMNRSISIGFGTVAQEAAGVRASHRHALVAVQHALSQGERQMVHYAEIESTNGPASNNRTAINQAIEAYVAGHLGSPDLGPEEIAAHVGLSAGYMRQIFRLDHDMPINEYITACRMAEARNLLATTDWTAKRIAEAVGYLDSRYFYTLFKKRTGETTEAYRKRIQAK